MGHQGKTKKNRTESKSAIAGSPLNSQTAVIATDQAGSTRRAVMISILLAGTVFLAFGRILSNDFVYLDDRVYVTENEVVQKGLTRDGIVWALTATRASNWHPLTWWSHMLDCELFGLNPAGHHFSSLLLHALNTVLMFLLFRRMTGACWPSVFVAAAFGLHPAHVESVAWVAERKDVLSTCFGLLAAMAYVWYFERISIARYAIVFILFALGLSAKPMLVTLPFLFLLFDYWPLGRTHVASTNLQDRFTCFGKLFAEKVPLLLLAAASSFVTVLAQRAGGAMMTVTMASFEVRVANAVVSYAKYLLSAIWPAGLAVYYPHPLRMPPMVEVFLAGAVLAGVTIAVVVNLRKRPWLAVGWFWFVGTLVPVIGLVQVGGQARADRYTYIPYIGLFIMVAWSVREFLRVRNSAPTSTIQLIFRGAAIASLIAFAGATFVQAGYWSDSKRLFQRAIDVAPDNTHAHIFMAQTLVREGRVGDAVTHFAEAVRLVPNEPYNLADYGRALFESGRVDEAFASLEQALKLMPSHAGAHYFLGMAHQSKQRPREAIGHFQEALRLDPQLLRAHYEMGVCYLLMGRNIEAIEHFKSWLAVDPNSSETLMRLGRCYYDLGNASAALETFQKATEVNPNDAHAHASLAQYLSWEGDLVGAINRYEQALRLLPNYVEAANNLAQIYATVDDEKLRNVTRAIELAEHARQLTEDRDPVSLDTLAAAYAEAGRFGDAVKTINRAIEIAKSSGESLAASHFEQRRMLYESGKSLRQATFGEGR